MAADTDSTSTQVLRPLSGALQIPYTTFLKNPIEDVIPHLAEVDPLLSELDNIERAKQEVSEALKALEAARKNLRDAKNAAKTRVREIYTEAEVVAADCRSTAAYTH